MRPLNIISYILILVAYVFIISLGIQKPECVLEENISAKFAIINCDKTLLIARRVNDQ